jgi:predicted alpha/beta-fold hydrolase
MNSPIPEPVQPLKSYRNAAEVSLFLAHVAEHFTKKPFKAYRLFNSGHAQTLAAYAWPRRYRFKRLTVKDEERLFEVEPSVRVMAHCRWQKDRSQHSTIVVWHGMEGSTSSVYMLAMAEKAFRAGFNVVRVNYRNCGGTERLGPTLYHGGMSGDLRTVIDELISKDGLKRIFPIGFSLGGNMVLKLAGEYGENPPGEVAAVCVVSPSVDLRASTELILNKSNWIYHKNFVRSLKNSIRVKQKLYPDLYDLGRLPRIQTIRDFDEQFTSVANGFANADDYYHQSSSVRVIDRIRIPTLIIHAKDDPFIPFEPLRQPAFTGNPYILVIATDRGGHVAFISAETNSEDRFWSENRAVEFCQFGETWLASISESA